MTTDRTFRDEKLRYDVDREAGKISAFSSCKTDKNQYFTGKEILHPGPTKINPII